MSDFSAMGFLSKSLYCVDSRPIRNIHAMVKCRDVGRVHLQTNLVKSYSSLEALFPNFLPIFRMFLCNIEDVRKSI